MQKIIAIATLLTISAWATCGLTDDQIKTSQTTPQATQNPKPATQVVVDEFVYLDDLTEKTFEVGYGTLGKHGDTGFPETDVQRCRLRSNGLEVKHGLSMTPKANMPNSLRARIENPYRKPVSPSHVVYDLGKRYHRFVTSVAINLPTSFDGLEHAQKEGWKGQSESPVRFRIIGDGKLLWESKGLQAHGEIQECDLKIVGLEQLRLEVVCDGSDKFAWSFWANPRVFYKPQTSTKLDEPSVPLAANSSKVVKAVPIDSPSEADLLKQKANEQKANEQKDMASAKELATKLAEKASVIAKNFSSTGKVAKVTAQSVYVTMGAATGIRIGNTLSVFRSSGEIKDPVTGAVLGAERPLISQLQVTEVNANYSKAKITSNLEAKIAIGDEVELKEKITIAVCPIRNDDSKPSNLGSAISEEITTRLVETGLKVVERSMIDSALRELIVQDTLLFETKSAQKLGELTGASFVVTGKIVSIRDESTAYVRLVDVRTAEIVLATSASLASDPKSPSGASSSNLHQSADNLKKPTNPSAASSGTSLAAGLPTFMTTKSLIKRVPDKGIRIQGHDKYNYSDQGAVRTKDSDFLNRDFTFEVVFAFKAGDRFANIGLGPGIADQSYNGLKDCVFLHIPAKGEGGGEVKLERFKIGSESIGKLSNDGPHLVRIIKEGEKVTFQVDAGNDGMTDDDFETTIVDIREYAPFLHSKNMPLFFGGSGEYISVSLK